MGTRSDREIADDRWPWHYRHHKSGTIKGVAATYNRYEYSTEKRAALNLWADHVVTIVEGRESKIVPLARGA